MGVLLELLTAAGAALGAPSTPAASTSQSERADRLAASQRIAAVAADCDNVGPASTARSLADHGGAAVEWIIAVRLGLHEPSLAWSECLHEAALSTLRSRVNLTRDELVDQLFEAPEPLPFEPAMLLLAELGDERDLAMLVDWALELELQSGSDEFSGAAAQALRSSSALLAAHGASDRRGWTRNLERAPAPLRLALVRGLADCGSEEALSRIAEQLDGPLVGDSLLLAELTRATRRSDRMHSAELRRAVRPLLSSSDEGTLRDAALCVGALGDEDGVQALIGLLDHAHPGVRANADWALQRITGRRLGPTSLAWSRWIDSELVWWEREAPQLLRTLAGPQRQARVAAAQALSAHRFPRHSLALELAEALPLNDAATVAIVGAALRQLGSEGAADALEARLGGVLDSEVRDQTLGVISALRAGRSASPTGGAKSR